MVHAYAAAEQTLQDLAKGRIEARALARLLDSGALLLGGDTVACKRLCTVERRILREMDDVDRCLAIAQGKLDRALEGGVLVLESQGDRTLGVVDDLNRAACALLEMGGNGASIAERRAHEQELGLRQLEQGNLPCPTAVHICIEVELVHGDVGDVCIRALRQSAVGQDLRRAADDWGGGVDGAITRDHADEIAAKDICQGKEFLADKGLDGRRVEGNLVTTQRKEVHTERDHGLTAARRSAEDDVLTAHKGKQRIFLMGPQLRAAVCRPQHKGLEDICSVCILALLVPDLVRKGTQGTIRLCVLALFNLLDCLLRLCSLLCHQLKPLEYTNGATILPQPCDTKTQMTAGSKKGR